MPHNDYGLIHEAFGNVYTISLYYDFEHAGANMSDSDELLVQGLKE